MPNRLDLRRVPLSLVLAAGMATMLGGCVAAVVPIAAGGMVGKKALFGHKSTKPRPEESAAAVPAPPAASAPAPPPARRDAPKLVADDAQPPTVKLVPPPPRAPAEPPAPATAVVATAATWDGIARTMAKLAARVPDHQKVDALQPRGDAPDVPCGTRRPAIAIDAATLAGGDYLYVGALYTMGFELVLMSPLKELPPGQVAALKKQGIAAPVRGKTLFASFPGSERSTRLAMAKQYCVVGLVGDHAGDFPNSILPGEPKARDSWFLVAKH